MTVVEPAKRVQRAAVFDRRCAFGLGITAPVHLMASACGASAAGRDVVLELRSPAELDCAWVPEAAERVLERRRRDGRLVMAVDHHPELGYRVYAPHNGRHLVSPEGTHISSTRPPGALWRWQRLLLAQVLPLAATLQGLELLHASAVDWKGRIFAIVASSGTGKTSVAAHVVARGGVLVTDDVLALEVKGDVAVAHPGAASLSIDPNELKRMPVSGRRRLGPRMGRADKVVLGAQVATFAAPLERMYILERPSSGRLRIVPLAPDPLQMLASSFNSYVRTPARIVNQLAVVDRLVKAVPVFSVRIPTGEDASSVTRAVIAHMDRR
jgi:hypothetical protein